MHLQIQLIVLFISCYAVNSRLLTTVEETDELINTIRLTMKDPVGHELELVCWADYFDLVYETVPLLGQFIYAENVAIKHHASGGVQLGASTFGTIKPSLKIVASDDRVAKLSWKE